MASEQQSVGVNKPSGIPRASKLPVLASKPSQTLLQATGEPPNKSASASAKATKPAAIPSLPRTAPATSRSTLDTGKPPAASRNLSHGSKHVSRSSISTVPSRLSGVKRPSQANGQTSRPATASSLRSLKIQENEDTDHGLDSVDGLQDATLPDSYDKLPTEPQNSAGASNLSKTPSNPHSSRPSLSDRTIDSIQRLPSTPKERRRSSFFSPVDSPMGPPPRPASSISRNGSNDSSRPSTGNGFTSFGHQSPAVRKLPASARPSTKSFNANLQPHGGIHHSKTAGNRPHSAIKGPKNSIAQSSGSSIASIPVTPVSKASGQQRVRETPASRMTTAKAAKPRRSISNAFGPAVKAPSADSGQAESTKSSHKARESENSVPATASPSNSSAALRQQIAAAKAAARKERSKGTSLQSENLSNGNQFDLDLHNDPFGQAPKDGKHILKNRINSARIDGRLNVAALELKRVPDEVMSMYSATAIEESNVAWAEVVDLTKFIAADNEIEEFEETVFPDKTAEDFDLDDQTEGNQFGGLEVLDVHNNRLQALPVGLRRLERLTVLNLAYNKLESSALDVIFQIPSLKDLRLGHNALSGTLPASINNLQRLETLDLQSNRLLGLPEALRELVCLKLLNVSSNQLTAVPTEALQELPLTELDASNNALIASLFPVGGMSGHSRLQILRVADNSIAALTFHETLDLPKLHTLDVSNNHLTSLPLLSNCEDLISLAAADNKITDLPEDFTSLRKLRNANFSGNEIRLLDNEIAKMESLESLILASNPLRDKKFLTMSAADIKRDLKARLAPADAETDAVERDTQDEVGALTTPPSLSPSASWKLKPNAVLDLAGRGYSDGINDSLGSFFRSNEVIRLNMQLNMLTAVPPALWLGQDLRVLNLSGNPLSSDYFYDELELPSLQELDISSCGLRTLEPLMSQLIATNLQTLNLTANRMTGALPTLRKFYPSLSTLLAGDNRFTSITAASLHGLHTVNLGNNCIEQLPAEVGLLWEEGLRILEIGGNAFRVPNHRVLEKGTEATMRWLKDRIPAPQDAAVVNGTYE